MLHSPFFEKFLELIRFVLRATITLKLVWAPIPHKYIADVSDQKLVCWWFPGMIHMHEPTESVNNDEVVAALELK